MSEHIIPIVDNFTREEDYDDIGHRYYCYVPQGSPYDRRKSMRMSCRRTEKETDKIDQGIARMEEM